MVTHSYVISDNSYRITPPIIPRADSGIIPFSCLNCGPISVLLRSHLYLGFISRKISDYWLIISYHEHKQSSNRFYSK